MRSSDIFDLIEQSALAYRPPDNQPSDGAGARVITIDDRQTDLQCYLRIKGGVLQIAFRGSDSVKDALTDINFFKKSIPYGNFSSKIRVHSGFLNVYKRDNVRGLIQSYITPQIKKIQITGHSLGAALATLCAVDLQYNFPEKDMDVIVFGSPRVGNKAFVKSYNKRVFKTLRVKNGGDIVTMVPPAIFGFRHAGSGLHVGIYKLLSFHDHSLTKYYSSLWHAKLC